MLNWITQPVIRKALASIFRKILAGFGVWLMTYDPIGQVIVDSSAQWAETIAAVLIIIWSVGWGVWEKFSKKPTTPVVIAIIITCFSVSTSRAQEVYPCYAGAAEKGYCVPVVGDHCAYTRYWTEDEKGALYCPGGEGVSNGYAPISPDTVAFSQLTDEPVCSPDTFYSSLSYEIYAGDPRYLNVFTTLREAEQHYFHCQLHNFQLLDENEMLKAGISPGQCQLCNDGNGGCLWKPQADTGPGAVLLMPSSYIGQNAVLNGASVVRTAVANGNRMHWFFNLMGASFGGPITIQLDGGDCVFIENPAVRND